MKIMRRLLLAAALSIWPAFAPAQLSTNTVLALIVNGTATSSQMLWPGGPGVFSCVATWNGATITLQFVGPDGSTLLAAGSATTFTSNGVGAFSLGRVKVQATVTAGPPAAAYCTAWPVPTLIG